MSKRRVVIVGAGHAGGQVAQTLVNEKLPDHITLVGEEAHPPYERPPLSKQYLLGNVPSDSAYLRSTSWWKESGVSLALGRRVRAIDRTRKVVHIGANELVAYDVLVMATGVRPRRWEGEGSESGKIFYLRGIDDATKLSHELHAGAHIAIVGAGFIGLEVAAAARTLGGTVTVLEAGARAMPRIVLPELAAAMTRYHEEHGVRFRFGVRVTAIEKEFVQLSNGESLRADAVVMGIGSIPNAELAAEAGLIVDDGILVDACGRTNDPCIYAVGDVARSLATPSVRLVRLESWQNAQDGAIAVAQVIAGRNPPHSGVPWFWSEQYQHILQCAGLPLYVDRTVWRGRPGNGPAMAFQMSGNRVVGVQALNGGRNMRWGKRLLEMGHAVDPERLSDPAMSLQEIARVA